MKSIIFGDAAVSFGDSLYITAVSMAIVFGVLMLISTILTLMKYIPQGEEKVQAKKATQNKTVAPATKTANISKSAVNEVKTNVAETKVNIDDITDEDMLAAMMVASIEASSDDENAYVRVKSIKQIN